MGIRWRTRFWLSNKCKISYCPADERADSGWTSSGWRLDTNWTAAHWRPDAHTRTVLMLLVLAELLTFVSMIKMNNVITWQFKVFLYYSCKTCIRFSVDVTCKLWIVAIFCTHNIYCMSVCPGRVIPTLWLFLRFLPFVFFLLKGFFFHQNVKFFLTQIEGLRTEYVVYCTDCKAHWDNVIVILSKIKSNQFYLY